MHKKSNVHLYFKCAIHTKKFYTFCTQHNFYLIIVTLFFTLDSPLAGQPHLSHRMAKALSAQSVVGEINHDQNLGTYIHVW